MNKLETDDGPVGLIGLGHIGMALTHRLGISGRSVVGYRRGGLEAFVAAGGIGAASVAEVAERCAIILLALPDATASATVVGQIVAAAERPRTIVDITSMSSHAAVSRAHEAVQAGHRYLEAPLSGIPQVVRDHQATMLVGAADGDLEEVRGLLDLLAAKVVPVGSVGAAGAVKSAALMMIAINLTGVAEALAYVESFGVEPTVALDALKTGPTASGALSHRGPLMAAHDYRATVGRLEDFGKMIAGIAAGAKTRTPMLRQAAALFEETAAAGLGDLDASAVIERLRFTTGQAQVL